MPTSKPTKTQELEARIKALEEKVNYQDIDFNEAIAFLWVGLSECQVALGLEEENEELAEMGPEDTGPSMTRMSLENAKLKEKVARLEKHGRTLEQALGKHQGKNFNEN